MNPNASPIITSLLDTDAYKLHMQQAVYHLYPNVTVAAEFRCRSDDKLGEYAAEIAHYVHLMGELTLSDAEYHFLSQRPFFRSDYLDWLKQFHFKPEQVEIRNVSGQLQIRITGLWQEVILWEVPLLALVSEIVHRHRTPHISSEHAVDRLHSKLIQFNQLSTGTDLSGFHLMDFGTRRRFSKQTQHAIVSTLQREFPYLSGTSNYALAQQLNLVPMGTQAHEWFQAHQQISPHLADCQRAALQAWLNEYPDNHLGIALTDCITMDAFLRDFTFSLASQYQGLRHDSGDPIQWGEKAISHYLQLGLDPKSKTLVFSDNLDFEKALQLYCHFHDRVRLSFGIGTHLTCDIKNVNPLNIVIKLVECQGKPVAKLSDSPGKTICEDPSFVKALHEAFDLPIRHAS